MRKVLLTTVAMAAMTAAGMTGAAQAQGAGGYYTPPSGDPMYSSSSMVNGDIQLSLGRAWIDDLKGTTDFNVFQGQGRANVAFGNTWNLLAEIDGTAYFGGDYDGYSDSTFGAYGHLWRGANGVRYGVFGGVRFDYLTFGTIGLEAEFDISNITLGGQGSYSFADPDCCGSINIFGLRGWADYYFTPNTKLTGELAWWNVDDFDSVDVIDVRGRLTHRFAGTPFNIFGEAAYWTISDYNVDAYSLTAGFSVLLDGGGTQQSYDQQVPFDFRANDAFGGGRVVAVSDSRLKKDIVKVGMLTDDIALYSFRYLWSDEVFVGVMAQDLLAVRPDAVVTSASGFYAVDYGALGTRMMRWDEWQAIQHAGRHAPLETPAATATAG